MTAADELPRLPRSVPEWHDDGAACRLFPELVDAWHDAKPGSARKRACRLICSGCPVRFVCARDALERGEPHGMWGGLDRKDRKQVALEFGFPPPVVLPEHGTNSRYAKHECRCWDCCNAHTVYESARRYHKRQAAAREARVVAVDRPVLAEVTVA